MEDDPVAKRQLNLRLSEDALDVLEAVRFVDGLGSLQQVAVEVLLEYAERRTKEPRIRSALRLRGEQAAERGGRLRALPNPKNMEAKDDS